MIEIIIPNYNGKDHISGCLLSLKNQSQNNFRITVIDNGSVDESCEIIEREFPEVNLIRLPVNTGFAKAVNVGIKEGIKNPQIKYFILLNNDIECDYFFVEELVKGFISNDVGSVASKMLNYYDRNLIDASGDYLNRWGLPSARGNKMKNSEEYNKAEYVFSACAGAAAYRREAFEIAGLFDEDFFAYYEDVDIGFRLQLMKFKCYYNPNAVCYHKREATSSKTKGLTTKYCEKNLVALRIKNYPFFLLIRFEVFFFFARFLRYYRMLRYNSFSVFISAFNGYLLGLTEIPKNLYKRKKIQQNRLLTVKEVLNILRKYK